MFETVEELRNAFPDLVAQIESAARADGVAAERTRIQEIENIQNVIGDTQMVQDAKFGANPMNAKDMLFAAAQKHAAVGTQMLGLLNADAAASGAAAVAGAAAPAGEPNPDSPEAMAAQAKADVAAFQKMKEVR